MQHRLVVTDIDKRKLKKNNMKTKFQELGNWLMLMLPIYEILIKQVCRKLVMKYVERRKVEKTMGIHGGGMKR